MNDRTKNYLGWALIIGVLVVAYSVWSYTSTFSQSIEPGSFRSFAATGEGKVVVKPDVAEFTFSVISKGNLDLATVRKDNDDKTNKAIAFVKGLGVDEKDIKTENFNLSPDYENYNCGGYPYSATRVCPPPKIVGYTITNTVAVKIRQDKFDKVGEALAGVVTAGANSVSELNFTVDDRVKAENDARDMAIKQAEVKAKAVAKAAGFKLGHLLAIEEGSVYPSYFDANRGGKVMTMAAELAPAPAIEPGSQDIVIKVTLRYEIK